MARISTHLFLRAPWVGVWAAEGVEAKSDPGKDSFCRVRSAIAVAMEKKASEKWTVAIALQPTSPLPPRLIEASGQGWPAQNLQGIPGTIVQGQWDVVTAWQLRQSWPGSTKLKFQIQSKETSWLSLNSR